MGTKIDSTSGGVITTPTSVSGKASASRAASTPAAASTSAGDDTVHLTGDAMQFKDLTEMVSRAPVADMKRVAEIRQSIANGQYAYNDKAVAAKLLMFDHSLAE